MSASLETLGKLFAERGYQTLARRLMEEAQGFREAGGPEELHVKPDPIVLVSTPSERVEGLKAPVVEALTEIQRLSPEQVLGLRAVEFDFVVPTYSKSMEQLVLEGRGRFGYVNESASFRSIVAPAAEVAVRSKNLAIPGSNNLSLDDQRQMVADFESAARKKRMPKGATLTGITFGLDHASTHTQIDFSFQDQNKGRFLYEGMFARTEDPTSGFNVADVGRSPGDSGLDVGVWDRHGYRRVWAVPVARPTGNR